MRNYVVAEITEAQRLTSARLADAALISAVESAAVACIECRPGGGRVLLAGNGGSAQTHNTSRASWLVVLPSTDRDCQQSLLQRIPRY